LRTTGQKGGTRRALHRLGAWELLKSPLQTYVQGPLGIARLFFWIARSSSIREGSPNA
jgi:hypothetical protein